MTSTESTEHLHVWDLTLSPVQASGQHLEEHPAANPPLEPLPYTSLNEVERPWVAKNPPLLLCSGEAK